MTDSELSAGFRAPEPEELEPLFPQYEIIGLVATGGMGAVYRAIQKSLDRTVAIKVLPGEFANDEAFCAAFEAEAKAMAKLNHPNLIGVYDFGEVGGMLFIVMEFVEGQSLHDACNGLVIEAAEAMRLMAGICAGLGHAHEHGILHRDIKPANIMLDEKLQPKIGDFGLARPLDTRVEEGELIFGTPGYTAPEVLEPPHRFDHRADLFSLGVLLNELLTGSVPANDPRPPSAVVHCDPRLDAVIRKATQPRPSGRYESAAEMAQEIQKIASSSGRRVIVSQGSPVARKHTALAPPPAISRPATHSALAPAGAGRQSPQGALGRPAYSVAPSGQGGSSIVIWLVLLAIIALLVFIFRHSLMDALNPPPPSPQPKTRIEHTIQPRVRPAPDDPARRPRGEDPAGSVENDAPLDE